MVPSEPKDILPKSPTFHIAKAEVRPWLTQAQGKMIVDLILLADSERFWYIDSRLREKAIGQEEVWVSATKQQGTFSVQPLFEQLRLAYDNPESMEIAARKLGAMKKGSKSFSAFLPNFEKAMLEAGGLHWDGQVKRTFLNTAIATDLQEALVATPIPATYVKYYNLLFAVSNNLECLRARKKRDVDLIRATGNLIKSSTATESTTTDEIDWIPTKWLIRQEKRCLRLMRPLRNRESKGSPQRC